MKEKRNENSELQMRKKALQASINSKNIVPGSNSWDLMFKKTKEEKLQLANAKAQWRAEQK